MQINTVNLLLNFQLPGYISKKEALPGLYLFYKYINNILNMQIC